MADEMDFKHTIEGPQLIEAYTVSGIEAPLGYLNDVKLWKLIRNLQVRVAKLEGADDHQANAEAGPAQ